MPRQATRKTSFSTQNSQEAALVLTSWMGELNRAAPAAWEISECVQGRGTRSVKKKMCLKRSWAGTNSLLSSKIKPGEQLKASADT